MVARERGGREGRLHLQCVVVCGQLSTSNLSKHIRKQCGRPSRSGRMHVCSRELRNTGIHTVEGMLGYCSKDEGLPHFQYMLQQSHRGPEASRGCKVQAGRSSPEQKQEVHSVTRRVTHRSCQSRQLPEPCRAPERRPQQLQLNFQQGQAASKNEKYVRPAVQIRA